MPLWPYHPIMHLRLLLRSILVVCFLPILNSFGAEKPLHALIITGGCCHNYAFQSQAITQAVAKVANVEWTILQDPRTGTKGEIDLYTDPNWAKPYDIIIHNECFADTDDAEYIRRITAAHKAGKPAMVIQCAMHTYRAAQVDDWREFLGVTSRRHDHMSKYPVKPAAPSHPIMKGFPESWTTPPDELYVIEKLWPGTKALATSVSEMDGKTYPVAWVHEYGKTRVFGTTFGHSDETFRDPVYLNLLANAFLWATATERAKGN
jgi:type 1 glutamine amidotransferase